MRPDAETLQADRAALPSPWELPAKARALYLGSVLSDYALRTGLASAVTGAMLPRSVFINGRAERDRLRFYAELTAAHDAERVFAPPPSGIPIRAERGRWPDGDGSPPGRLQLLRFGSPFVPLNPDIRRDYLRHASNATARAQHWRHDGPPRPTLIVIHGFGASPAWFNTLFFSLRDFFADGWDILLFTMPFHGGRRGSRAPFNGAEMFAGGFSRMNEAVMQAICDLRVLLGYLRRIGAPRIGVTGLSLGGYAAALLASVDPDLDFAVPNAAVATIPGLIDSWFPANVGQAILGRVKGLPPELVNEALSVTSPLTYEPRVARERLMVVAGLADRLTPPEQSLMLWEHWGRPELRWFPGSHVLHFQRGAYLDAMRKLIADPRPRPQSAAA
ncbi:MAG TPA: hypothetical protein VG223_06460 [Solirubrobacteraceae bacterium]|nr:hypothetical protein [Solirubrobacteraceae bacterium]